MSILSKLPTGLTIEDLDLHVYSSGVQTDSELVKLTLTELGGGSYRLDGIDEVLDDFVTVTGEHNSVGFSIDDFPPRTAPPNVVVPVKVTGLSAVDLELKFFVDDVEVAGSLSSEEIPGTGDYRITGWGGDSAAAGEYLIQYTVSGQVFQKYFNVASINALSLRRYMSEGGTVSVEELQPFIDAAVQQYESQTGRYFESGTQDVTFHLSDPKTTIFVHPQSSEIVSIEKDGSVLDATLYDRIGGTIRGKIGFSPAIYKVTFKHTGDGADKEVVNKVHQLAAHLWRSRRQTRPPSISEGQGEGGARLPFDIWTFLNRQKKRLAS